MQWIKHLGGTVLAVVSTPEKAAVARRLGADHTILSSEDEAARVRVVFGALMKDHKGLPWLTIGKPDGTDVKRVLYNAQKVTKAKQRPRGLRVQSLRPRASAPMLLRASWLCWAASRGLQQVRRCLRRPVVICWTASR